MTKSYKKDFPIFANNPGLVFLDNAASVQKPQYVINGVGQFAANDYANIHRWLYELSERAEETYHYSKKVVADFLWCKASEIIYTYNSTYGINLMAQALCKAGKLWKWDTVLIGIWEHHANVMPWQILSEIYGFQIKLIEMDDNYDIDREDFNNDYDETVKVVSVGHVSNVTGKIYDLKEIKSKLRDDTFFMVDGSQSVPNFSVNVAEIGCDCFVFTWHKVMAYTGIWAVYLSKPWIRELSPMVSWGWAIEEVTIDGYTFLRTHEKFEPGTPNLTGAVSLLKAFEYIQSIWGFETIWNHEQEMVEYTLAKFAEVEDKVKLIGPKVAKDRVWVFSFVILWDIKPNIFWEKMAEQNICVRCGGHCAHPLHQYLWEQGTCRMSLYLYNDKEDIDKFFQVLNEILS